MNTKPPLLAPGEPTAGWLVLIGGGEFSFGETEEIDRFLISKMPAGNRRIAFLPTASGSTEYAQHLGSYFARLDSTLEVINVPMYRGRDVRRDKNLAMLREAGMIYAGGGVLSRVVGALRDTVASAAIMESLGRGCVVAAIGAAASAAGSVVAGSVASSVTSGLGWIPATAIEAGFVAAEDAHLRQLASLPDVLLAIGIPRSTAVAIDPDRRVRILGTGDVMVIRKGVAGN